MSDLFPTLATIAALFFFGWAIPGPNHLAIASSAVHRGRTGGVLTAWGVASGAVLWTLLAMGGLAAAFDLYPTMFLAFRALGSGYLIYLGLRALRSVATGGMKAVGTNAPARAGNTYFVGLLVAMTNPKALLFFGSILTAVIPKDADISTLLVVLSEVAVISFGLNTFAALFFSNSKVMAGFQAAGPAIAAIFGLLFCALGLIVAWEVVKEVTNF